MDLSSFAQDDRAARLSSRAARSLLVATSNHAAAVGQGFARVASKVDLAMPLEADEVQFEPLVLGSGLVSHPEHERHHPVLLVNRRALKRPPKAGTLRPAMERKEVTAALTGLLDEARPPKEFVFLAVDPPVPQFHPSEEARGSGSSGTLGAGVTAASGHHAILTAGHVAPLHDTVKDSGQKKGFVTFSRDPAATLGSAPAADVAVVEPTGQPGGGGPAIASTVPGGPSDEVAIHGAVSGAVTTRIMGFTPFLYAPSMAGMWGQVYFTTHGPTQAGDSGAPALLSGTAQLIGHLVGASGTITSYIQAIDLQLQAAGAKLRPTS